MSDLAQLRNKIGVSSDTKYGSALDADKYGAQEAHVVSAECRTRSRFRYSRRTDMILLTNNEGTLGVPTTARLLAEGAHALDAIEAGIRLIEADPSVRTVGRGGWPNLLGEMELDACMMDGSTLRTGAVGALQGFLHPVSVAREIMRRLPHEFLVGDGAARFAREIGAEPADNLIEDSRRAWQAWFDNEVPRNSDARGPTRRSPRSAGMRSIRRSAAIPRCSWRTTQRTISVPAPAHPAGAGNIPAASATARLSAPARTPTRDTARPHAPVPAR